MKKIYFSLFIASLAFGSRAANHFVNVSNNFFAPANLTVSVGDTITWVWNEGNHTTTSTNIPLGAMPWDSNINLNNMMYMYVITVQGSYDYQCTFHVSMGMIGHFTAIETSGMTEIPSVNNLNVTADPSTLELTVDLATTRTGILNLTLNDITGRQVRQLVSGLQQAGEHHFRYNVAGIAKGMYLVKLSLDSDNFVRKVILR